MVAQTEFTKIWEQGAEAERNKILGQLLISQGNRQGPGDATSGSSPGGKGWRRRGQPNRDQGQGASPGRVYRAPGNLPPTLKELQDAQNRESPIDLGQLQEEGYGDEDGITSLQIKGQPSDMGTFDIDPTKKPRTESQKRRADKLRYRKMRGGEGSEQAGDILDKLGESGVGLPNFIQNIKPKDLLKILQLIPAAGGALLQNQLQIGQSGPAPTWPPHKWPYPTPGQGPLPNPDIPEKIAELNPAQIKALEELKGVDKLPPTERLQRMREITEKVKGLA